MGLVQKGIQGGRQTERRIGACGTPAEGKRCLLEARADRSPFELGGESARRSPHTAGLARETHAWARYMNDFLAAAVDLGPYRHSARGAVLAPFHVARKQLAVAVRALVVDDELPPVALVHIPPPSRRSGMSQAPAEGPVESASSRPAERALSARIAGDIRAPQSAEG